MASHRITWVNYNCSKRSKHLKGNCAVSNKNSQGASMFLFFERMTSN